MTQYYTRRFHSHSAQCGVRGNFLLCGPVISQSLHITKDKYQSVHRDLLFIKSLLMSNRTLGISTLLSWLLRGVTSRVASNDIVPNLSIKKLKQGRIHGHKMRSRSY